MVAAKLIGALAVLSLCSLVIMQSKLIEAIAWFAGAGVFAMQSLWSLPEALQLQFAMQFVFAGCVCYSLQALVRSAARVERDESLFWVHAG